MVLLVYDQLAHKPPAFCVAEVVTACHLLDWSYGRGVACAVIASSQGPLSRLPAKAPVSTQLQGAAGSTVVSGRVFQQVQFRQG